MQAEACAPPLHYIPGRRGCRAKPCAPRCTFFTVDIGGSSPARSADEPIRRRRSLRPCPATAVSSVSLTGHSLTDSKRSPVVAVVSRMC